MLKKVIKSWESVKSKSVLNIEKVYKSWYARKYEKVHWEVEKAWESKLNIKKVSQSVLTVEEVW